MESENTLYYGDNLDILRRYVPNDSIDLIYLDPPFKSNQSYNILFREKNGTSSAAQIKVFEDTWHWDSKAEETYVELTEEAPKRVADLIIAFRSFLGSNDMMAYLVMMSPRLIELYRVLKSNGSIYLHCDPTASHYLKLILDSIFGIKNFRNEIIWHYRTGNIAKKQFQRKHDTIFFYSKTENNLFIPQEIKEYYAQLYGPKFKPSFKGRKHSVDKYGEYRISFIDDVWNISAVFTLSKEHLDYPTQKPERLLERIIKASSKEGDIVLDPFCGCGTTITVAEKLNRKWIGIDITHLAISLMRHRLQNTFLYDVKYKVIGEPVDLRGAEELAKQDPYQFQWWALSLVGARPAESEKKKGGDKGIDGYIYFHDEPRKTKKIVIQVKSGHVNPSQIRDLRGVVDREQAQMGVFISFNEPTIGMRKEEVSTGYYRSTIWNKDYQKLQIITIKELLDGKRIDYPPKTNITFKKAKKYAPVNQDQLSLDKKESSRLNNEE
ncbi:MAG: restriction endonuclease [Candidatus Marinimicrobia bacterium]|nr:restriction endonuclease [Candidatus Neomarinimicrobiota bacterium]